MTLDLYPFDAGTDQGFMFTSPDFPEVPRQPIVEITSRVPSHPANSFFYPRVAHLPRIAHVTLSRVHNAQPAWMRLLQSDRGVAGTEQDNAIPKTKNRFYGLIKGNRRHVQYIIGKNSVTKCEQSLNTVCSRCPHYDHVHTVIHTRCDMPVTALNNAMSPHVTHIVKAVWTHTHTTFTLPTICHPCSLKL